MHDPGRIIKESKLCNILYNQLKDGSFELAADYNRVMLARE
jgi:hypothetical protein